MERKKLLFYIHIYIRILAQDLKSKISYRTDFIISTIGMIATNIAGFISFWIMFKNFTSIDGWGYYEILFLYGFSLVSITPAQCMLDNNWNLREYIYNGDFIKYCFRPINIFFYYQSEVFDIKGIGQLFFGIGTLLYSWVKLELGFSVLMILKMIMYLLTASLIMAALQNAAAAVSFWVENSFYVLDLVTRFKDYAKYPVSIFGSVFRFVFTFIIPIAFISYYPSLAVLRPDRVPVLSVISPLFGLIFFLISYKIWMLGAMKYNGTGS